MDLKSLIKTTVDNKPPRIVIHGTHGIGKSTLAAGADNPVFIQTEDGLASIEVAHFPLATELTQVWEYMGMLIQDDHDYKTFVLDTVDWLQTLIWNEVCKTHNVETIESIGYGKGYTFAMQFWNKFFDGLEKLRARGLVCVILAHNEIKPFNPPDGDSYDRYQIKLHKTIASKLEEWADCVLFANFETIVNAEDGKAVNQSQRPRVLNTADSPAWRAKSRYDLPDKLPLDFPKLIEAIKNNNASAPKTKIEPKTKPVSN